MICNFKNKMAKKHAEQSAELSELRDALIEIAEIIAGKDDENG